MTKSTWVKIPAAVKVGYGDAVSWQWASERRELWRSAWGLRHEYSEGLTVQREGIVDSKRSVGTAVIVTVLRLGGNAEKK